MNKKQKRAAKLLRQRELVNAAKQEKRDLTAEEQAEFDTLQGEIDDLTRQIEAEEQDQGDEPTPPDNTRQMVDEAISGERQRVAGITSLCRSAGVEPDRFISEGRTLDETRAAVLDQLIQRGGPIGSRVSVGGSGEDDFRRDAADGMVMRGGLTPEGAGSGARQFAAMSFRDLAIECMERAGESGARRMSSDELFTAIMQRQYLTPTAAFPSILDTAIEKAYVAGHKQVPVTFDRWTKKGTLSDFKIHDNKYIAGPIGDFKEVPEGGELKNDKPVDAKLPTRQLKTWGKQFTLSRQAFINDDIGLVTSIPARHAAAARRTINRQCYEILMKNPKIYDDKALFSADHKNLLKSGTGITKEAVQAMIMAISTQKDQFDQAITIRPAMLVLPVGMGFDLFTLFNSPTIQTTDNTQAVNPLYRYGLQQVEDPEINRLAGAGAAPWFLLGATEDTAFIEVDYLNGQETPNIRRMETPGQLGFVWDIYLDWGIQVMDFRGAVKNPGVKIENTLLA
ncbi:MAG: hypothetical protein K2M42_06090 [Oscillospiraceae bacterium]|nr:hypothetical protein [Oscillospiraceae bacterium]